MLKVIILKDGKMVYSENKSNLAAINKFKELIRKAQMEHSKTSSALIEKKPESQNLDSPIELVDSVRRNSLERIGQDIETQTDFITSDTSLTENELREFRGILAVKPNEDRINFLDIEQKHWEEQAETEEAVGNERKAKLYRAFFDTAELKADEIRLRLDQKPKGEKALSIVE